WFAASWRVGHRAGHGGGALRGGGELGGGGGPRGGQGGDSRRAHDKGPPHPGLFPWVLGAPHGAANLKLPGVSVKHPHAANIVIRIREFHVDYRDHSQGARRRDFPGG